MVSRCRVSKANAMEYRQKVNLKKRAALQKNTYRRTYDDKTDI